MQSSPHDPGMTVDPWLMSASIRLRAGDIEGGFDSLLSAACICPERGDIWAGLSGLGLHRNTSLCAGIFANRSLTIAPNAGACLALAEIRQRLGAGHESMQWIIAAICVDPGFAQAWIEFAQRTEQSESALALVAVSRAWISGNRTEATLGNHADLLARTGQHEEARQIVEQLLHMHSLSPKPFLILGMIEIALANWIAASSNFAVALVLAPGEFGACIGCSSAFGRTNHYAGATNWARRARWLQPDNPVGWNALGIALRPLGLAKESYNAFEHARDLAPAWLTTHSNLILASCYLPDNADRDRQLFDAFAQALPKRHFPIGLRRHKDDRPLNVGYISGDFRNHPVGIFLASTLEAHDREKVTPILYANQYQHDAMTARLQRCAAMKFISGLSDTQLAEKIMRDEVDVLVDLSGHTAGNRLGVLSLRCAPVQLTWGGLVGSTGMDFLDGILADPVQIPPDLAEGYAEPVIYLLPDYVRFTPPEFDLETGELPALGNGYLTFGCTNNILKVDDQSLMLWARILLQLPQSKLLFKGPGFDHAPTQARLTRQFAAADIGAGRLIFEGPSPAEQFMACYQRIDISLDPVTYSGGLTTLESLWMGVPVLTFPGIRFTARHSASHLTALGLSDWIATSRDDYVERVITKARDLNLLSSLRQSLRQCMYGSPLCDGQHMARQLESIYFAKYKKFEADMLRGSA